MKHTLLLAACAVALATGAAAQETRSRGPAAIDFVAVEPPFGPVIRDSPYSGEATTTVTQVLADGTRIERTTVTRLYRDGPGAYGASRRSSVSAGWCHAKRSYRSC